MLIEYKMRIKKWNGPWVVFCGRFDSWKHWDVFKALEQSRGHEFFGAVSVIRE
jgi:hypothetical protein